MSIPRLSIAASVMILALGLTGCTAPTEAPSPSTAPSSSPSTTTEPSAPEPFVLSADGVTPFRLGESVADADPEGALLAWDGELCSEPGYPAEGRWLPTEGGESAGLWVITRDRAEDGAVEQVGVTSPDYRTESGVGVGSTREELLAAEPTAELLEVPDSSSEGQVLGSPSDAYVVEGDRGTITFEVASEESADYWEPEQVGTVVLIWIADETIDPMNRSGSGAAGLCFT